jgi:hypothetical protein
MSTVSGRLFAATLMEPKACPADTRGGVSLRYQYGCWQNEHGVLGDVRLVYSKFSGLFEFQLGAMLHLYSRWRGGAGGNRDRVSLVSVPKFSPNPTEAQPAPAFAYTPDLDLAVEAYSRKLAADPNEPRLSVAQRIADDISISKLGGTPTVATATASRLLAVFRGKESEWLIYLCSVCFISSPCHQS